MLFLDGVFIDGMKGSVTRFRWVKAPTNDELTQLTHTITQRIARYLECQGLLVRNVENSYLTLEAMEEGPLDLLLGSSITYRIAVGPQQERKVFALQTLLDCRPDNPIAPTAGKAAGFSLHAGVATRAHERDKLERLCRYITRPAVFTKRLSLTRNGKVSYELKTPYSEVRLTSYSNRWISLPASLPWYPGPESISSAITAYLHPIARFERWCRRPGGTRVARSRHLRRHRGNPTKLIQFNPGLIDTDQGTAGP